MNNETKKEAISNAPRYGGWAVYDFIVDRQLGFALGNVVKYIARAGKKDGASTLDDLRKAKTYLDKHIETLEAQEMKQEQGK
jgi:hypothetical protein